MGTELLSFISISFVAIEFICDIDLSRKVGKYRNGFSKAL